MADRTCRFCSLLLDDIVPMGYELTEGAKRTKSHCTSPSCHWCLPCQARRLEVNTSQA